MLFHFIDHIMAKYYRPERQYLWYFNQNASSMNFSDKKYGQVLIIKNSFLDLTKGDYTALQYISIGRF